MRIEGWTIGELAKRLKLSEHTIVVRIGRAKIAPIFKGAVYPPDTLKAIKNTPVGRPKKTNLP